MSASAGGEGPNLLSRFAAHVVEGGWLPEGETVVVACSGGLDSTVLLHLLRFGPDGSALPRVELHVAHFDHGMRPESAEDAGRVRRLAEDWGLPCTVGRAENPPEGETEARTARHGFLETVRTATGARWIVMGHHADDQAETILFRIFRGTGLRGLSGMPEARSPGILRPLLPFRRAELDAYAREAEIPVLPDATNRDLRFARNVIRHEILPRAEEAVSAGATGALLRLGRLARESEAGWDSLLPELCDDVVIERSKGRTVIDRQAFLEFHPAVRSRILRSLLAPLGARPNEAGTRAALEFTRTTASGREWRLSGDVVLTREFDRLVLSGKGAPPRGTADSRDDSGPSAATRGSGVPLLIPGPEPGMRSVQVGGRRLVVRWGPHAPSDALWVEPFPPSRLRFPLYLRGWQPGDRIRLAAGSRKLKKVLAEARIPRGERGRIPILTDARGEVLWIPGVAKAAVVRDPARPEKVLAEGPLFIGIEEEATDAGSF
ncbi:MAG: tRNA lysidine(34) synthetase TilS [Gemmatimonadota bacterium]